jgi:ubiquinone/menaquinone biosynthesis C-methylase UbiE
VNPAISNVGFGGSNQGFFSLDFVPALVLRTALKVELFSQFNDGAASLAELQGRLRVSPRGLTLMLETLVMVRLLALDNGRYLLTPLSATFLDSRSDSYLGPAVIAQIEQLQRWWRLDEAIIYGTTPHTPIEGSDDDGDFFGALIQALFAINAPAAKMVAEQLPPIHRALDLGCGAAVWSLALALTQPNCYVTAIDRDSVLEKVTLDCVEGFDCTKQYHFQAGDFREMRLPERNYDVAFLGHILHNEGEAASRELLKRVHTCLRPNGCVVVAEMVGADPPSANVQSLLFDLNMLLFTQEGRVFSAPELESMLLEAGFTRYEWLATPSPSPILIGYM